LTIFAPNDAAFAKLPTGTLESIIADEEKLRLFIRNHVVVGRRGLGETPAIKPILAASGKMHEIQINVEHGKKTIGNVEIIESDIKAKNGLIHIIDSVLAP
jgi:uncharacterized surface protein with fasciclin (FAS1) repeats